MEQLIKNILRDIFPHQVEGLDLDARYLSELGLEPVDHFGGLGGFNQLQDLSVAGQHIYSWKGLPSLPLLRNLELTDNDFENFEHAPDLPSLSHLDLSLNQLQNLQYMPEWPALTTLNLAHNLLQSLDGLQGRELEILVISGNKRLYNLAPLHEIRSLRQVYATGLAVADWAWLQDLPHLELLAFQPTSPSRIFALEHTPSLRNLTLHLSRCRHEVSIPHIPHLHSLSVTKGHSVHELVLPDAPELEELSVTFCSLHRFPDIRRFPRLQSLDLRFCELEDIPDLSSLSQLQDVYLEGNPLNRSLFELMKTRTDIRWHL